MSAGPSNIDAIFAKLDERIDIGQLRANNAKAATTLQIGEAKTIAGTTVDKEYRILTSKGNCTSHSKLQTLHKCPRLYELEMLKANSGSSAIADDGIINLDFTFGHAVGAGIQTYGATKSLQAAQFAAFISWRADYDAEALDKQGNPKNKSLAWALYAVEKFAWFMDQELGDWEVLRLPETNAPAVELSFGVDTQNGFFHFGHIDTVLRHKDTNKLAVWEGKTTVFAEVNDAAYGNSYQALGYSVVLDALARALRLPGSDYEVFYIVYSSKAREFSLLPFTKSRTQRAEWLQDILLTHATIQKYQELQFFPKRGDSCLDKYGKTCHWYGQCHMRNSSLFPVAKVSTVSSLEEVKAVDYKFTLEELVAAQKQGG
jgi:hypothetical protein